MLTFRNTVVVFIIILLILIGVDYLIPVNKLVYAGIGIGFLWLLVWGSKNVRSGFYMDTLNYGDRNTKSISLTFDDGPDAQVTPMILDILRKYQVKATFFIIGNKAESNPEIISRIDKEGHLIGSHSYSHHFFFDLYSTRAMVKEMLKTEKIVFSIIGKRIKLFRPPYGVTNPPLAKAVRMMQYLPIGWSLKSNDTVIKDESELLKNVIENVRNGDIILFHDNKPWNVRTLDNLIPELQSRNFKLSRLDELLTLHAYVY